MPLVPQTNAFWLSYLLDYLQTQYTINGPQKKRSDNRNDIVAVFADMEDWLNFDPKTNFGSEERLSSAADCLELCIELGWISEEHLNSDETFTGSDESFTTQKPRKKDARNAVHEGLDSTPPAKGHDARTEPLHVSVGVVGGSEQPAVQLPRRHIFFPPTPEKVVSADNPSARARIGSTDTNHRHANRSELPKPPSPSKNVKIDINAGQPAKQEDKSDGAQVTRGGRVLRSRIKGNG